jgi:hypothetical protein
VNAGLMGAAQAIATLDGHLPEDVNVTIDWTSAYGGVLSVWLTDRAAAMNLLRLLADIGVVRRTIPSAETWTGKLRDVQVRICLVDPSFGRSAA